MLNLVVLGQMAHACYGDAPEKSGPSHLTFQRHFRSSEPTLIDHIPIDRLIDLLLIGLRKLR